MTHEERNTVSEIFASLLVNLYVIFKLMAMFEDGRLAGDDAVMIWARAMLWVIPIGIALVIATTILFNILHAIAIATGTASPSFLVDERDKIISNFGMKVTGIVLSIGFIGAVIALANGIAPLSAFIAMWFGFAAGDLAGNLAKMIRYRMG